MKHVVRGIKRGQVLVRTLAFYGMLFLIYVGWGQALRLGALKLNWTFSIVKMWFDVLA